MNLKEMIEKITEESLENRRQKNGVIKFNNITDLKLYILERMQKKA